MVHKVPGDKNVADALTKPTDRNKIDEHVKNTGGVFGKSRHELAPAIEEIESTANNDHEEWRGGSEEEI